MRNDWIMLTATGYIGTPQFERIAHGCRIVAVAQTPDDTVNRHVETGRIDAVRALWSPPMGVDPDTWADAVAELLAGFAASLPTRAMALLAPVTPDADVIADFRMDMERDERAIEAMTRR